MKPNEIEKELDKLFENIQGMEVSEEQNNLLTEDIIKIIKKYFQ